MYHQYKLAIFITFICLLNGCASVPYEEQVTSANIKVENASVPYEEQFTSANIKLGDTPQRVLELLGKPAKDWSLRPYRVLSFCKTQPFKNYMIDYMFRENELIHVNSYNNNETGKCYDFFRNIYYSDLMTAFEENWKSSVYKIDSLEITHLRPRKKESVCEHGHQNKLIINGTIGPDSSFAVERLLEQITPCVDKSGKIIHPIKVSLKSKGGLLKDGYSLGRTLRKFNATTIIKNDRIMKNDALCASSCAVAFLGGTKRSLEDNAKILFHAPYLKNNSYQMEPSIYCTKDKTLLDELEAYYIEMIGVNDGKRIFDRTMWYCSTEDGWVVTGGNAAKLYGIATQ